MTRNAYAQVYSLIRHERKPILGALETLARLGYSGVEGIGPNTGGLTVQGFKKHLDDLGLDMCSVMALNNEAEWEYGVAVGARFTVAGFKYESKKREDILRACDTCNELSRRIKNAGLMNLIHNHATEFEWVEGEEGKTRVYDLLLEATDPDCVGFEIDAGWVKFGNANPEDYIRNHSGRFPIVHVKECDRIAQTDEERDHFPRKVLAMGPPTFVDGAPVFSPVQQQMMYDARNFNVELGRGLVDWKAIAAAADAQNMPVYFVSEREYYHCYGADGDPVICAQKDCEFIRSI